MKHKIATMVAAGWYGLAVSALAALPAPAALPERAAPAATAATPAAPPSRWATAFASFDADDAAHPRAPGGVLFVGSSSIRFWTDVEAQFANLPVVINRGFGGSQLSDCVRHLSRLVLAYRPRTVLVYAGDNDLAAGVAPRDVLKRFVSFVDGVHAELPWTRIVYISVKPSPSRAQLMPQIREANALIRDYASAAENVAFADVFTPMLDASGHPRPELFRKDELHLNAQGYALWRQIIAQYVY